MANQKLCFKLKNTPFKGNPQVGGFYTPEAKLPSSPPPKAINCDGGSADKSDTINRGCAIKAAAMALSRTYEPESKSDDIAEQTILLAERYFNYITNGLQTIEAPDDNEPEIPF